MSVPSRAAHRLARPRPRRRALAVTLVAAASALFAAPGPARAWDPASTHQGITDHAVQRSAMHRRWMASSELARGLFTPLRVEPGLLTEDEIRMIELAKRATPADNGAVPLGGPGSCPGADAPPETQRYCVRGDTWESTAMGWLRLGMIAQVDPPARLTNHFFDRRDPDSKVWRDEELAAYVLRRRQVRSNGASVASGWTATAFDGEHPSAMAWIAREDDPLAPTALYHHLERSAMAATLREREHHLAMALLATGALLHLLQDASVPAHARGDASAFNMPLSTQPGDRGLPLQEFARVNFGRHGLPLDRPETLAPPDGTPLTDSIAGHLVGDEHYEGLARFTGDRFFSESSVPRPVAIDPALSPTEAATKLLGDVRLADVERQGAYLDPWPADEGYLRTSTGRVLSAWAYDGRGRIEAYLDEGVYREQVASLVPRAVRASASVLDLLWPAWPGPVAQAGPVLELEVPEDLQPGAEVVVLTQREDGGREVLQRVAVTPGASNRLVGLPPVSDAGGRVVLVLLGIRTSGEPFVAEQTLRPDRAPNTTARPAPTPESPASETEPEAGTEPEVDPEAEPEAETETEPESEAGAGADADADADDPPVGG